MNGSNELLKKKRRPASRLVSSLFHCFCFQWLTGQRVLSVNRVNSFPEEWSSSGSNFKKEVRKKKINKRRRSKIIKRIRRTLIREKCAAASIRRGHVVKRKEPDAKAWRLHGRKNRSVIGRSFN